MNFSKTKAGLNINITGNPQAWWSICRTEIWKQRHIVTSEHNILLLDSDYTIYKFLQKLI